MSAATDTSRANLRIDDLLAGYGDRVVIEKLSLAVLPGEWFVLMGPNGCGKSTLLDCVAGRVQPAAGTIHIAGASLREASFAAKRELGYGCPPEALPGLLTARQCFEVHAGAKGLAAVDAQVMGLADELQFTPYLDAFVDTMSLGTRQKLSVLLALLGNPRLIVLDEAFNGLDPASALALKRHLRERLNAAGASLLLATHALDIAERYADRAGLLMEGRMICEWTKDEIRRAMEGGQAFESAVAAAARRSR